MNGKLAMLTYLVRSRDGGIAEVMGLGNLIALLFYPTIRVCGVYVPGCIFRFVVMSHTHTDECCPPYLNALHLNVFTTVRTFFIT